MMAVNNEKQFENCDSVKIIVIEKFILPITTLKTVKKDEKKVIILL